jgi:hypothetical protein
VTEPKDFIEFTDSQESAALSAFASELRQAHPGVELSPSFEIELADGLRNSWSWRGSIRQSPLLRIAASLLLLTALAVPVAAVVALLQTPDSDRPEIGFQMPTELLIDRESPQVPRVVPPSEPLGDDLLFDGAWALAIEQQNRFAQASASWQIRFLESPIAADLFKQRQTAVQALARRENNPAAVELFEQLESALQSGEYPTAFPCSSQELIDQLALAPDLAPFLAGWLWVMSAQVPPSGIDVDMSWPNAPWLAELP